MIFAFDIFVFDTSTFTWTCLFCMNKTSRRETTHQQLFAFSSFKEFPERSSNNLHKENAKYVGVSKNKDTPKWMVYYGKPYQNGWFGGTIIFGNPPTCSQRRPQNNPKHLNHNETSPSECHWPPLQLLASPVACRHRAIFLCSWDLFLVHLPTNWPYKSMGSCGFQYNIITSDQIIT